MIDLPTSLIHYPVGSPFMHISLLNLNCKPVIPNCYIRQVTKFQRAGLCIMGSLMQSTSNTHLVYHGRVGGHTVKESAARGIIKEPWRRLHQGEQHAVMQIPAATSCRQLPEEVGEEGQQDRHTGQRGVDVVVGAHLKGATGNVAEVTFAGGGDDANFVDDNEVKENRDNDFTDHLLMKLTCGDAILQYLMRCMTKPF